MTETERRVVYWVPRILCVAFAAFLAMFALDVFNGPSGLLERAVALVMHLVPAGLVLAVLALVWRREWIGALLFPLLALVHLFAKWGQLNWAGYAVIDGTLVLLGVLFWINWRIRPAMRPAVS